MPVDWSNLAGSLVRTLRANQAESDTQQQLAQEKQKQQFSEGLQQNQFGLDKNYLDFNIQQAQAKQQKAQQLGQAAVADLTERWQNATDPAEKADIAARIKYVASGGDPNRALMGIRTPAPVKPPKLSFDTEYEGDKAFRVGVDPSTGDVKTRRPAGGLRMSAQEVAQAQALKYGIDATNQLLPELQRRAQDYKSPDSLVGKAAGYLGRLKGYGEYSTLHSDVPDARLYIQTKNLQARIIAGLMRSGGSRAMSFVSLIKDHTPDPTDDPKLLLDKVQNWQQIMQQNRSDLATGPFDAPSSSRSPASGAGAPAGDDGLAPRSSRPGALSPSPANVKTSPKGRRYSVDADGNPVAFLNPSTGRWEPLD